MKYLVGCISLVVTLALIIQYPALFFVLIGVGIIIWLINANKKASSKPLQKDTHLQYPDNAPNQRPQGQSVSPVHKQPSYTVSATTQPTQSKHLSTSNDMRWLGEGEHMIVGSHVINDPLAYYCRGSRFALDASCIDINLSIGKPVNEPKGMLGYWPSYYRLTPGQRANYLAWMAGGRQAPLVDIGYAFIFFYGLERRVLTDKSDVVTVLKEVIRMLNVYTFSGSFNSYLSHFIAYVTCRSGVERLDEGSFRYVFMDNFKSWNNEIASVALAWLYTNEKPFPVKCAYQFAKQDPRFPRSAVIQRLPDQFESLFLRKYREKFGEGMVLRCAKRPLRFGYHPASPTLLQANNSSIVRPVEIADVQGIPSQFKPLIDVWSACIEELRPLSRKLAKGTEITTREAYAVLPASLKAEIDHPDKDKWDLVVTRNLRKDGMAIAPISALAALSNIEERPKLTQKQSEDLATTAFDVGYTIVPDPRVTGRPYDWKDIVCLLSPDGKPSLPKGDAYQSASAVLELGVAVAAADGTVHDDEINHITQFLETQFVLEPSDATRLEAYMEVLVSQPTSLAKISKRLQVVLSEKQRESLGQFMVGVIATDGVIDNEEISTLKSAYKALGISIDKLETIIENIQASDQPVEVRRSRKSSRAGEPIPARGSQPVQPVTIDAEAVQRILRETAEVARMLSEAMGHNEAEEAIEVEIQPTSTSELPSALSGVTAQDQRLSSLDSRYHASLGELLSSSKWSKSDLDALARRQGLMPSGMLDVINSWADENLGDFLVEDGDPYTVNIQLMEDKT